MSNPELKKYTIVGMIMDGGEVHEKIPFLDGETPEQHDQVILDYISMMHDTFGIEVFNTTTRYVYETVFIDPTL